MATRWIMLSILFIARTAMAFQYQAAAALSPLVVEHYGVDLVDIGFLIGLYMGPGALIALPGGGLAARFGDRRIMLVSLGLMLAGGVLMALAPGWSGLVLGRVLAGIGGVTINIVMTKMVVDWFAGAEIATPPAIARTIDPNPAHAAAFAEAHARYKTTYIALKDLT